MGRASGMAIAMATLIVGCASQPAPMPVPEGATLCDEPRPQICTRDYRPTCATKTDHSQYVASNPCEACANLEVKYFVDGDCP